MFDWAKGRGAGCQVSTQALGLQDTVVGQGRVTRTCAGGWLAFAWNEEDFLDCEGCLLEASNVVDRLAMANHQEMEGHVGRLVGCPSGPLDDNVTSGSVATDR